MNNKKIGVALLIISIIFLFVIVQLMAGYDTQAKELGCFNDKGCSKLESALSITHLAFGMLGFVFALSFYLIFFSRGEEAILRRLEEEKARGLGEEKFSLILKGLDNYEQKALTAVKEQEGITQNTLRMRTDMSKAKLSYVLGDLEKKGLVKREKKGKTLAVFLKVNV